MGYRIDYGPSAPKKQSKTWPQLRLQLFTAVFLLLFVLGIKRSWPEGVEKLRSLLLPRDTPSASQTAIQAFVDDLQNGSSVGDAVTTFCREIVENADTAE